MIQEVACEVCATPIANNLVVVGDACVFSCDEEVIFKQLKQKEGNVEIWSAETFERLQHLELTPAGAVDPLVGSFLQGVCSVPAQDVHDHVCIGSSTGSLHVHFCNNVFHFTEVTTVSGAGVPVLALQESRERGGCFFCTSADQNISEYNIKGNNCRLLQKAQLSACAVALETLPGKVVCGTTNGSIVILSEESLLPVCSIVAHSRFLSGLHMHGTQPWLLSCAQDGTIAVWDLSRIDEHAIDVKHSLLWNNALLVGASWLSEGKPQVAVASCSSTMIRVYEISPVERGT